MTSKSISILAEHPGPIGLSGNEIEIQLRVYEENRHRFRHDSLARSRVFLNFHRIFGEPNSPNYDVYLSARKQGGTQHYIGTLSFFSVRPKSPENSDGVNLKLKIDSPIKELLGPETDNTENFTLLLKPQDESKDQVSIDIEFTFLCSVPPNQ